jgi:hypothetical protein
MDVAEATSMLLLWQLTLTQVAMDRAADEMRSLRQ